MSQMNNFEQDTLKDRELEILRLIALGLTNAEIAERLFLSTETVRWYNKSIYAKLGTSRRTEAVAIAQAQGLLETSNQESVIVTEPTSTSALPPQSTPFVGRQGELAELLNVLKRPHVRLLSILGPGGIGKTRLSLALAEHLSNEFQRAVYYVSVAELTSSDEFVLALGQTLGISFFTGDFTREHLLEYLADKSGVIVVDNLETLPSAITLLHEIVVTATNISIIATSREKLNLRSETVFALDGLGLKTEATSTDEAIQLLVQSAQRVVPDFEANPENLPDLIKICQLVDGSPLAIELAAAWLDILSPEQIAQEIEQNYQFLAVELRDFPERHQSMTATFVASWSRLSPEEQMSLAKMGVFCSGFSPSAAQVVAGASLRNLQVLINKSLLQVPKAGRYTLHQLLRQFALDHLAEQNLHQEIARTHCEYYLKWLSENEIFLKGRDQLGGLNQIEVEFENIRTAWRCAVNEALIDQISPPLEALFWFCLMRNRYVEGELLFQDAARVFANDSSPAGQVLYARLVVRGIWLRRWREGTYAYNDNILEQLQQCLDIFQDNGTAFDMHHCLLILGNASNVVDDEINRAKTYFEQSLAGFTEAGDDFYRAWVLHFMGRASPSKAIELQTASLQLRTALNDLNGMIYAQYNLASYWLQMGDLQRSQQLAEEMFTLSEKTNERSGQLMATTILSLVAFLQGDFSQAETRSQQAWTRAIELHHGLGKTYAELVQNLLSLINSDKDTALKLESLPTPQMIRYFVDLGSAMDYYSRGDNDKAVDRLVAALEYADGVEGKGLIAWCLPLCALVINQRGQHTRAKSLCALAEYYIPNTWVQYWSPYRQQVEQWQELASVSQTTDLLELASNLMVELADFSGTSSPLPANVLLANQKLADPLSKRELEVLGLIAKGFRNKEIADHMVVAVSTVKKHISHIYDKLNVESRAQVILLAQERGLV